jgi:hypothetical protein
MRFIPAKLHGFLDYSVALSLVAGPLILGFEGLSLSLAVAGGIGLFLYSLLTDYSVSIQRLLPFRAHLAFDFIAASVLTAAPFLFDFGKIETAFYLVIGIAVIAVVLVTDPNIEPEVAPASA